MLSTVYALNKLSDKNVGGLDKNDWNINGVIQEYFLKLKHPFCVFFFWKSAIE